MKKQQTTKRALAVSAISLLMCVSMLVGTTFAWFTDSVVSGNNKIIAGNLKIEMEYANAPDGTYRSAKDAKDLFVAPDGETKGLWEPGHTEVAYLKITNKGSLALQYNLSVSSFEETTGLTEDGKEIKLSEILKFGATAPAEAAPAAFTRDTARATAAASTVKLGEYLKTNVSLLPGKSHYIALVVTMPESVGNEANYRGNAIPEITFALTLMATQDTVESDSFGSDYDDKAVYENGFHWVDPVKETVAPQNQAFFYENEAKTLSISGISNGDVSIDVKPTSEPSEFLATLPDGTTIVTYDIKVSGQVADSDVTVQLFIGKNLDGVVTLYHNRQPMAGTYDPASGTITFITKEFSNFSVTYSTADVWDGTADTSWYNENDTEFFLDTAEQLAGLAELVTGDTTFAGVTITLTKDMDLYCEDTTPSADGDPLTFRPIGDHSKNGTFEGTFDGNGKTISNLYQNGWDLWGAYGSYGLFGNLNNATVKNLTIEGAESYIEGGDVGGITGSATGNCVFENITIADSDFGTYNNGNGGIIGWSGAGNYTFKNITIAEDVVLAGLWGSFDSSIGGVVGQGEPGATYNFENVDVACRLDVYNDCTASYDYYNYRMCGMLIGRLEETTTIDGANYPDTTKYDINCTNVTVTYGAWANYHYCDPTPGHNNGRGMRVEPGYSYGGLPADYDHSQCTTHHNELIPFDQIFGGAQYGVKGLKAYEGVDVIYNNH